MLVPTIAILLQALADDAIQFLRQARIQSHRGRGRAIQDAVEDLSRRVAMEWRPARRHLVQDDAEREQVSARVQLLTAYLLGRHVRDRSRYTPRARLADSGGGGPSRFVTA